MINEVAQMREGRAGRFLFELFPAGETSTILDHEECIQGGSRLLRDGLIDPTVEAARRNGSDVVRRFVQRSKGRKFKALLGEFFQRNVDQVGQVFFGSGGLDHGFEQTGARGRTIRLEVLCGPDEGNMPLPRSAAIIAVQVRDIEVGINEPDDVLENGNGNLTGGNEASQALIRFEQHKKAYLSNTAFGGTSRQKAFCRGGGIDLGQVFRGQVSLEAGIGCSFNRRHGFRRFDTRSYQLDTSIDFCYYSNVVVDAAIS